jgi:hypothetical protein
MPRQRQDLNLSKRVAADPRFRPRFVDNRVIKSLLPGFQLQGAILRFHLLLKHFYVRGKLNCSNFPTFFTSVWSHTDKCLICFHEKCRLTLKYAYWKRIF